jgi:hypothetical protein
MVNICSNPEPNTDIAKILISATNLEEKYNNFENEEINSILDIEKNSLCIMMKNQNLYLDDKSIKCIVLALYVHMYSEILNLKI